MFIATANVTHTIPAPLKDRMEIIQLSGYTHLEKLAIARQFLVRKQRNEHGLDEAKIVVADDAIEEIINSYTREAGVRNLEREIGSIFRKVARAVLREGEQYTVQVGGEKVRELLGKPRFRLAEARGEQRRSASRRGSPGPKWAGRSSTPRSRSRGARAT